MRTRVERRPQLGEEEKQRRESEITQQEKLESRSGAWKRHATEKQERDEGLLLGDNRDLAEQGRIELTNLGGKRMNSTKLHSLSLSCGTQAGETTLGGFGLQRWRARRRIKEKENQAGTSPRQARQTERATWNTCRQQRVPTAGKNWRGLRGLAAKRKRKRKGNGSWAGRFELGSGGAEHEDERR